MTTNDIFTYRVPIEKNLKHDDNTCIEISIGYSKGGMNYLTGQVDDRGYYVYLTPTQGNVFSIFDGFKYCLHTCGRKSKKASRESMTAAINLMERLMAHLACECQYIVKDEDIFEAIRQIANARDRM